MQSLVCDPKWEAGWDEKGDGGRMQPAAFSLCEVKKGRHLVCWIEMR